MSTIGIQPTSANFLSQTGFDFKVNKLPNVSYFVQSVTIPGLTVPSPIQQTKLLGIPRPGDRAIYEDLTITFIVDENLNNWKEMYNWLASYGGENKFDGTKQLFADEEYETSAILSILTSHKNINLTFTFFGLFPTTLSGLDLSATATSIDYLQATATFKYTNYSIR